MSQEARENILERRVSQGRKFFTVDEASAEMKSDARNCVEDMGKTRVGWLNWFNHFCQSQLAIKSKIDERSQEYADRMLKQSGLYVGTLAGITYNRGKRALMLVRRTQLRKEFLTGMQEYYTDQEKPLQQEGLYGRLSVAFEKQRVAVKVGTAQPRETILNAINALQLEVDAELGQREIDMQDKLEEFRQQAKDEQHLKNVLLELGVIETSTQLHDLLDRNAKGDTALYTLINSHPVLNKAGAEDLRQELTGTVENLRRRGSWYALWLNKGTSGWYRAFLEGKKQTISDDQTFQVLQEELYDRRIRVRIPGASPLDLEVERKDDRTGLYYVFDPRSKSPAVIDVREREMSYVDRQNRVRHFSFRDSPDSIALLN